MTEKAISSLFLWTSLFGILVGFGVNLDFHWTKIRRFFSRMIRITYLARCQGTAIAGEVLYDADISQVCSRDIAGLPNLYFSFLLMHDEVLIFRTWLCKWGWPCNPSNWSWRRDQTCQVALHRLLMLRSMTYGLPYEVLFILVYGSHGLPL